jgi:hypothetical protein
MCVAVKVMIGFQGGMEEGSGKSYLGLESSAVRICVERQ